MKNLQILSPLFALIFLLSTSCEKEAFIPLNLKSSLESIDVLEKDVVAFATQEQQSAPELMIKREACFSSKGQTLILVHPENFSFYENNNMYEVIWYKDKDELSTGARLNCASTGKYKVVISDSEYSWSIEYSLDLESEI